MTKRRIIKHERALRDLEDRSEYIRQDNPRAALQFLDVAQATFQQLSSMSGLGARRDSLIPRSEAGQVSYRVFVTPMGKELFW